MFYFNYFIKKIIFFLLFIYVSIFSSIDTIKKKYESNNNAKKTLGFLNNKERYSVDVRGKDKKKIGVGLKKITFSSNNNRNIEINNQENISSYNNYSKDKSINKEEELSDEEIEELLKSFFESDGSLDDLF
jgi:hypothetical protein